MENDIIENYLHDICSYIKNKDVHKEISDEIREHIYEIIDEYTKDDLSEDEAVNKAIKRLGSASECGIKLNKVHRAKPDVVSITLTLALALIGIITMYAIEKNKIVQFTSFFDNIRGLIVGVIIATGIYFFDYRKLKRYSYHIYVAAIIILILPLIKTDHFYTTEIAGLYISHVYIHLIGVILSLISLSGIINIKSINSKTDLLIIEVIGVIPLILLFVAPDIMVSIIYLCGINVIFLSSKVKKSLKIGLICTEVAFIVPGLIALVSEPYRMERIYSILNPTNDPDGNGYAITRIRYLLFYSTLFGNETYERIFRLPDLESNLALVYAIYNFGIIFGVISISILIAFIVRIFNIIRKVKDSYGRTLMLSIGTIFFMQVIINLLSNLGIMAVFMGLPFISYGSTNSIISISMVGLICSIFRRRGLSDRVSVN